MRLIPLLAALALGENGGTPALDGVRVGASWIHDGIEINPLNGDQAPGISLAADSEAKVVIVLGRR